MHRPVCCVCLSCYIKKAIGEIPTRGGINNNDVDLYPLNRVLPLLR